jgi:hypothetical protein
MRSESADSTIPTNAGGKGKMVMAILPQCRVLFICDLPHGCPLK